MNRLAVSLFAVTLTGGCVSSNVGGINDPFILGISSPVNEVTLKQQRHQIHPGTYNVFSCSHGIRLYDDSDFAPSPLQYIDRYVKFELKLPAERVVLTRFDVYHNQQLPKWREKSAAFNAGLGLLGEAIASDMKQKAMDEGTDVVGCAGEESGEFSVFELGEQPDFDATPIVAHIELTVDGKKYKARGFKNTFALAPQTVFVRGDVREAVTFALKDIKSQIKQGESKS